MQGQTEAQCINKIYNLIKKQEAKLDRFKADRSWRCKHNMQDATTGLTIDPKETDALHELNGMKKCYNLLNGVD